MSKAKVEIHPAAAGGLGPIGLKNPPIDPDRSLYLDSTAGDAPVTSTWAQIKAFLKLYFDTLYAAIGLAHARLHSITSILDHSSAATPGKILKADANGLPVDASNTDAEVADAVAKKHTQGTDTALGAVGTKNPPIDADKALYRDSTAADALVTSTWTQVKAFLKTYFDTLYGALGLAHTRLHSITSTLDHSSAATPGKILKADANGLPVDATNTDAEVSDAVTKKHTQGTDVALGVVGAKNPPINADKSLYRDSAAGDALVTSTWTQIKAFLKTYWDTLYEAIGSVATHNGLVLSHLTHNNNNYFIGYGNETVTGVPSATVIGGPDPKAIKAPALTAISDPLNALDVSDWYGASGAYRQSDADSDATHIEDNDASFPASIRLTVVKWASNAAGTLNTGIGLIITVDSDTLTIVKCSGVNFAASYYYWIKHSEWVAPVTGIYTVEYAVLTLPAEADKPFQAYLCYYQGTSAPALNAQVALHSPVSAYCMPSGTTIANFTAGDHVWVGLFHGGTSGTPTLFTADPSHIRLRIFLLKQTA